MHAVPETEPLAVKDGSALLLRACVQMYGVLTRRRVFHDALAAMRAQARAAGFLPQAGR